MILTISIQNSRKNIKSEVILTNQKERNRFMRFVVVGGVGFFVDAGTFNFLTLFLISILSSPVFFLFVQLY